MEGLTPEAARALSGLALFEAWRDGRLPEPPISRLFGMRLIEVAPGRIVFEGTPGPQHYNPIGTVHGGFAATLLDSAMACAAHTTLPAGPGCTTLELKISYVRPIFTETGSVRAEGSVVNAGRRVIMAEGRLLDGAGKLLAHGTTTCLVLAPP